METDVRLLADIDSTTRARVVEALADVFSEDPVNTWFLRAGEEKPQALQRWFDFACFEFCPEPIVYADPDFESVAVWFSSDHYKPVPLFKGLGQIPTYLSFTGWARLSRFLRVGLSGEKAHPWHLNPFYLMFVGVRPRSRGKGLGTRVLAPMLRRCDEQGSHAYLENSNARNFTFYNRQGFEELSKIDLGSAGPDWWAMLRNPRTH